MVIGSYPVLVHGLAACIIYLVALAVYRLYLGPLAKFPGPRLAALSNWYEFYYDVLKDGDFTWQIKRLHMKYGKIRIRHAKHGVVEHCWAETGPTGLNSS